MRLYADSSAVIAGILEHRADVLGALGAGDLVASELTLLECRRAILRARVSRRISTKDSERALRSLEHLMEDAQLLAIDPRILERAGRAFPQEPVRSLDAIHLATAELVAREGPLTMLSLDDRVRQNAVAFGWSVSPEP